MNLKELLTEIVKSVVDDKDAVEVNEVIGEVSSIYELKVKTADIPNVIGKDGTTFKALQHIVFIAAKRRKVKAIVNLVE
jgi:predicted RNA-binding protein YlqC (UPF0109 family)